MNEKILADLKDAMKNQEKFKLSVLRMLKSALQLEAINKKADLNDNEVMAVIKKQVKVRKDSLEEYKKYGKTDQVESLTEEINILNNYLPAEMTEEEINKIISDVFEIIKPTSMKDMGAIMKALNEKITNADMSLVSKLVKDKLS